MSTSCGLCRGNAEPMPAPGKWKAEAKLSLLPTLLDALPTPKATGRPSANASVMWRFFTTSVYKSGDLPVLATREALQNSFDAIRAALRSRQITHGHFEVEWKEEERSLSWSDNGIGMDTATILDKFLTIGESGKGSAANSGEAAGGFGVAKAVILGASRSFRWELHTRNNLAVGNGANADVEIFEAPPRQGTRITIYDVSPNFPAGMTMPGRHGWTSRTGCGSCWAPTTWT